MAKKKQSAGSYLKWGVGLGVTAAAAASTYFLYGTEEGKKQRKKIRGWTVKMKGEVLEKMEQAKEINEKRYKEIVDQVAGKYKKLKNVEQKEVDAIVKDLKKHWKNIKKHLEVDQKPAPKSGSRKRAAKSTKKTSRSAQSKKKS